MFCKDFGRAVVAKKRERITKAYGHRLLWWMAEFSLRSLLNSSLMDRVDASLVYRLIVRRLGAVVAQPANEAS